MTSENNWYSIQDLFNTLSLLETEDDLEFLEWYLVEGSNRIDELSRQLRTFFNYKNSVIRIRFSRSREEYKKYKNELILKQENELSNLFFQYKLLIDNIRANEETIAEKINILLQNVRHQPKNLERNILKEIKKHGDDIWMILHVLSTFDIHYYPQLLHVAIRIASILCSAEGEFFWPFSCFYRELKQSYTRLEEEVSGLLHSNEKLQFKENKKKKRVIVVEYSWWALLLQESLVVNII